MSNKFGQSVVGELNGKEAVIVPHLVEDNSIQVLEITVGETVIRVPALQFDSAYRTAQQRRNAELQAERDAKTQSVGG